MIHSTQLEKDKISQLLFKYSLPAIIAMLVNAFYNVVDRICIGRGVGSIGIAGATICFPLMTMIVALTLLVGIGSVTLISMNLGKKDSNQAESVLNNSLLLIIVISIVFTMFCYINIDWILKLFGASATVLPYAREYLKIILLGVIFQGIGAGLNHCIRADGNPQKSMQVMMTGAIANIILTPFFIFVLGLGIRGAAIGTVISQGITAAIVLHYFTIGNSRLKIRVSSLQFNMKNSLKILAIGSAPFVSQLAASLLNIILNKWLVSYSGDISVSAMGVVTTTSLLLLMPVYGINQGLQPILGYNFGACRYDRVKEVIKLSIVWATIITITGFIIIFFCSKSIILLFAKDNSELVKIGIEMFSIYLLGMPLLGFQLVGASCFLAIGKPKQALFLSLLRQVILLIPFIIIFAHIFGFRGILFAGPIADLFSFLITGMFLSREFRNFSSNELIYKGA